MSNVPLLRAKKSCTKPKKLGGKLWSFSESRDHFRVIRNASLDQRDNFSPHEKFLKNKKFQLWVFFVCLLQNTGMEH